MNAVLNIVRDLLLRWINFFSQQDKRYLNILNVGPKLTSGYLLPGNYKESYFD